MSSASTDSQNRPKTSIELVTDASTLPESLKQAFAEAGLRLSSVHLAGRKPQPLKLDSGTGIILALVVDDLPEPWLDTLLETAPAPVLFLDWDGTTGEPVVQALKHKLAEQAENRRKRREENRAGETTLRTDPLVAAQAAMPTTWLLAASIGGPEALRSFLGRLPGDLPACLILAQHIGREFQEQLVRQLDAACPLPVRLLESGALHRPGQVLVVPSDCQLRLDGQGRFLLKHAQQRFTPCIDQIAAGLLPQLGPALGMIVFSGMSNDGVAGSHAVHVAGGPVWVQTPETCVVASMVEGTMATTETGLAGTPEELADMLVSVYH